MATREVHQITVDRVIYDCTLSHLLESYLTPDQIAFAYSSPTPPAFRGRPYERKREMYSHKQPGVPPLYHAQKPSAPELPLANEYSMLLNSPITSFFGTSTPDEVSSNSSSGLTSHLSSWESATFSHFINNNNGPTHRRNPSNETNLFSLESVTDVDVSVDKVDLSQLLGLQEPSSPHTTSSMHSDAIFSDVSDFPMPVTAISSRMTEYQMPMVPLEERFNADFFKSWN